MMSAGQDKQAVLGLFAKWPQPGAVKTRLAAETSSEWAARVAAAFLQDTLDRLAAFPARRILVFAPRAAATAAFTALAAGRFILTPQIEGTLGQRMAAFFQQHLRAGAGKVVLLGTDSPTLPLALVEQAFRELDRADLVLGPATDGGYYLIGCGSRLPPVFDGITWSGSGVLAETVARLEDPTWTLALLPPWYDVDTLADWRMLRGHLRALRRAGIDPQAPRTEELATD